MPPPTPNPYQKTSSDAGWDLPETHRDAARSETDGRPASTTIRVTRPTTLVLLKLFAFDDRYRNIRGPAEAEHDREEAQTHAADVVAIMTANLDADAFREFL
jgi:hypothetical protein